jgi:hypothetical protein
MAQDASSPRTELIGSDRVEGTAVYDHTGKYVGSIKRLMIEKLSGQVAYAVMSFGGFLGFGESSHVIPWDKLTYDTDLSGYKTSITETDLRSAPAFASIDEKWLDNTQQAELDAYHRIPPHGRSI